MRWLMFLVLILFAGGALTGCENTIEGVGDDVEESGEAIEEAFE